MSAVHSPIGESGLNLSAKFGESDVGERRAWLALEVGPPLHHRLTPVSVAPSIVAVAFFPRKSLHRREIVIPLTRSA